jgi:hypothetical protein
MPKVALPNSKEFCTPSAVYSESTARLTIFCKHGGVESHVAVDIHACARTITPAGGAPHANGS